MIIFLEAPERSERHSERSARHSERSEESRSPQAGTPHFVRGDARVGGDGGVRGDARHRHSERSERHSERSEESRLPEAETPP